MSPSKLADRRQRRARRALFWILAAGLLAYGLFAGDHRPHHLALLWLEERRTEERIEQLAAERIELEERLAAVEADPLALEALAREKGLVRPGDLVYRIVPVSPDVRKAAAESVAVEAARQPSAAEEPEGREGREPGTAADDGRSGGPVAPAGVAPAPDAGGARTEPAGGRTGPAGGPAGSRAATPESADPEWRWLNEPRPADPAPRPAADTLPGG